MGSLRGDTRPSPRAQGEDCWGIRWLLGGRCVGRRASGALGRGRFRGGRGSPCPLLLQRLQEGGGGPGEKWGGLGTGRWAQAWRPAVGLPSPQEAHRLWRRPRVSTGRAGRQSARVCVQRGWARVQAGASEGRRALLATPADGTRHVCRACVFSHGLWRKPGGGGRAPRCSRSGWQPQLLPAVTRVLVTVTQRPGQEGP